MPWSRRIPTRPPTPHADAAERTAPTARRLVPQRPRRRPLKRPTPTLPIITVGFILFLPACSTPDTPDTPDPAAPLATAPRADAPPPRRYDPGDGPDSPDTDTLLDELVVRNAEGGTEAEQTLLTAGSAAAPADARRRAVLRIATSTAGGLPPYVDLYRAILREPGTDATVAAAAASALATHGRADDAGLIVPLLDSPEGYTRWQAAVALQRLHDPAAVPALRRTLADDADADARMASAAALAQYPRREAFDALMAALDDQDSGVARAAHDALVAITGHDAGDDPAAWLAYADANLTTLFADARPVTYWKYPGPPPWYVKLLLPWTTRPPVPITPTGYTPPS